MDWFYEFVQEMVAKYANEGTKMDTSRVVKKQCPASSWSGFIGENRVRKALEDAGYEAFNTRRRVTPADIWAAKADRGVLHMALISVTATTTEVTEQPCYAKDKEFLEFAEVVLEGIGTSPSVPDQIKQMFHIVSAGYSGLVLDQHGFVLKNDSRELGHVRSYDRFPYLKNLKEDIGEIHGLATLTHA